MRKIRYKNLPLIIIFTIGMKKILSTITVFFYLAMSCGIMINLHYCMGRVQSVDFYAAEKKTCGKCGMPLDKSHGCCKDEVKIFKLQSDQNKASASYSIKNIDLPAIVPSDFIAASFYNIDKSLHYYDHSPPLLAEQGIYLQNCVFRI